MNARFFLLARRACRHLRPLIPVALAVVVVSGCTKSQEAPSNQDPEAVAWVNGEPIIREDFERELHRLKVDDPEGLPTSGTFPAQRKGLLTDIINRRLLLQEAQRHKVVVGMNEVESVVKSIRSGWDDEAFVSLLSDKELTTPGLKREVRDMLMIRHYLRDHVHSRIAVTDSEIAKFVDDHPQRRITPEKVRVRQVVVNTRAQAEQILRELRGGLKFEDAALKYSVSPEASKGGDLGFFTSNEMPGFFDVCFALRVGQTSKVVESEYGFHLFKVIDKRAEVELPIHKLNEFVEAELLLSKQRRAERDHVAALRDKAEIKYGAEANQTK